MSCIRKIVLGIIILNLCLLGLLPATAVQAQDHYKPCTAMADIKFTVEITNVSDSSLTSTPFAPGVWALHPLFHAGMADWGAGLENLAEDGNPAPLADSLASWGVQHGVFNTPRGKDGPGPLLPGDTYAFTVTASKYGPNLSFALMFVQSNDWFIGTGGNGLALLNDMGGVHAGGDITDQLYLWDAGTEADEPIGEGENQAPRQAGPNTGPADENNTVRLVTGDDVPAVSDLVQVTLTRARPTIFDVTIQNISGDSDYPTPFAPGLFVAHTDPEVFYLEGHPALFFEGRPDLGAGLEALAEDGNPGILHMSVATSGRMVMPVFTDKFGIFNTPVGTDGPGPLLPDSAYAFTVTADPDTPHLSLALMFVQSNDWFAATPAQGISLFEADGTPISGTISMGLYDAGTEEDEAFAEGANQAPRQAGPNTGPADDDNTVRKVEMIDANELLHVTVTPRTVQTFQVSVANISEGAPLAPGVAVSHHACDAIFSTGMPDRGLGLEALAEDGHPGTLSATLQSQGLSTARVVNQTVGADEPGPLLPGTTYEFTMEVHPAESSLSLAFMYVLSNDLFVGTSGAGIDLWDAHGQPISGDVTEHLNLWDAGTEANQAPGEGSDQPLMQSCPNTGPADANTAVRPVSGEYTVHGQTIMAESDGYDYPAVSDLVTVTVTPVDTETE